MGPGRARRAGRCGAAAHVLAAAIVSGACASGTRHPGREVVPWAGDLASAVEAVASAAHGCDLKLMDGRRAEAGTSAFLVFLEGWQSPKPESSVVTVRVVAGVEVAIEAHPLAEYGMSPPDIRAGSEGFVCAPCTAARAEIPMVRYSRGLALGNAARASRCLGKALEAAGRAVAPETK